MNTLVALLALSMFTVASAHVVAEPYEYKEGESQMEGYIAYDDHAPGKRPAVLIIHDWNSIDDYERNRAKQLAGMGYVALAGDIYGKGARPTDTAGSMRESAKYRGDMPLFRRRLTAALDALKKHPKVDANKIAVIGYCFGGTAAVELARTGADIRGAVSFHGSPTLDAEGTKRIKAKVVISHGADDPLVAESQLNAMLKEFKEAKIDYQFIAYSGAVHSFTNPFAGNNVASGNAYNATADRRSWEHLTSFLAEIFAG